MILHIYIYIFGNKFDCIKIYEMKKIQSVQRMISFVEMRHCWKSKDELISDLLLWTPSHGHAIVGRQTRTYLLQLCTGSGCSLKERWVYMRMYVWVYIYIYIYVCESAYMYVYVYRSIQVSMWQHRGQYGPVGRGSRIHQLFLFR